MVKNYVNVEEMFVVAKDVKKLLDELGETPFEPFKEKQEEGMILHAILEKQVIIALNESFIYFLKCVS